MYQVSSCISGFFQYFRFSSVSQVFSCISDLGPVSQFSSCISGIFFYLRFPPVSQHYSFIPGFFLYFRFSSASQVSSCISAFLLTLFFPPVSELSLCVSTTLFSLSQVSLVYNSILGFLLFLRYLWFSFCISHQAVTLHSTRTVTIPASCFLNYYSTVFPPPFNCHLYTVSPIFTRSKYVTSMK